MKTYLSITYVLGRTSETANFIRPRKANRPTDKGAARMVAAYLSDRGRETRPSEISIERIQEACYQ